MYSLEVIKRGVAEFSHAANLIKKEYGGGNICYKIDMLWCLFRYGARPLDYWRFEFFKKSSFERNRFETYYRQLNLIKKMQKSVGGSIIIADNKEWEYRTYSKFIKRNWLLLYPTDSQEKVYTFINQYNRIFAKPTGEALGRGARIVDCKNKSQIEQLLEDLRYKPFLLEECLENVEWLKQINPTSLNTLRVFSIVDSKGNTQVFECLLRAGTKGMNIDNWGAGGIVYHLDLKTGIIDRPGVDKCGNKYIYHPDSNIKMVGFSIPNIHDIVDYVCQLAKVVPSARVVGWDIAITNKGLDFVEMNCPGGHDILQAFGEPYYDYIKKNIQ